jgi:multidrug efflux pump subunit AcrA (membrane-fusion protein)
MKIKKLAKKLIPCVAIALLAVMLVASSSPAVAVDIVTLQTTDALVTYTAQGTGVFRDHIRVTSPLDGDIEEICVREGDRVSKGDVIVVIGAEDLSYQIRRLEHEIESLNAQITNLNLAARKENSALSGQRNDLLEQKQLLESQSYVNGESEKNRAVQIDLQQTIVSNDRSNLDLARSALQDYSDNNVDYLDDPEYNALVQTVNNAETQLRMSEQKLLDLQQETLSPGYYDERRQSIDAQIRRIDGEINQDYNTGLRSYYQSQIEATRLQIEQLRNEQGRATVTASQSGVCSTLEIDAIGAVSQGAVIAVISTTPVIEVFVPVREMGGIAIGDEVTLTVAQRAGDFFGAGTVIDIGAQAIVMLSPLGVEESRVRVLIADDSDTIAPGWQTDVKFTVYQRENSIIVPEKALFILDGQDYVWLVENGAVTLRHVVTGAKVVGGYIAEQGLSSGDVVVADANVQALASGRKVRVS